MAEFTVYQLGNYLFRLPRRNYFSARVAADEWAYYIQHSMPMTQGLHQQISTWKVPFPTRLIPIERNEVVIPVPTYHSPFLDDSTANQVFPWPLDPLPRSYLYLLPESTQTITIPSAQLPPLEDPRVNHPLITRHIDLKIPRLVIDKPPVPSQMQLKIPVRVKHARPAPYSIPPIQIPCIQELHHTPESQTHGLISPVQILDTSPNQPSQITPLPIIQNASPVGPFRPPITHSLVPALHRRSKIPIPVQHLSPARPPRISSIQIRATTSQSTQTDIPVPIPQTSSESTQTLPTCPQMTSQSMQTTPLPEPVSLMTSQSIQTTAIPSPISPTPTSLPEMVTQSPVPILIIPAQTPNPEPSEMVRIPVAPDLPETSPLPPIQNCSPIPAGQSPEPENQTPNPQPSTQTGAGLPIEFKEVFKQMALGGLVQDVKYEPTNQPQKDLTRFLEALRNTIRPLLQKALESKHGVTFWVSLQVKYAHPSKEIKDMRPPFLHSGKRRLIHETELDSILDEITQAILIRNAHFNRQNPGLLLYDIVNFRCQNNTVQSPLGSRLSGAATFSRPQTRNRQC